MGGRNWFSEAGGNVQLSREQADHFFDIEAWRLLSPAERCGFQIRQEYVVMPFKEFRLTFDSVLGEPLADVAFQNPPFLARRLVEAGHEPPELGEVVARIPEGDRGPLADLAPSDSMKP